eukprot:PITA_14545
MSNEMVDIKKQVVETSSKKPFKPYKRNPPFATKPPSTISNAESDLEEDEVSTVEEKTNDKEIIGEDRHDSQLQQEATINAIPKYVVKLEELYDLKDRFKKPTNSKLQISTLRFELVNLGADLKPQIINLGLHLTMNEKSAFIHLLKKYKNVFSRNYEDLKTYDTSIIQHTIPMISDEKPVQWKLRNIYPNLENQIKSELNKLLKVKIIFPVRHPRWVSNLLPIRKKNGDIRICIDFRNLNKACQKDSFPLPLME